MKSYALEIDWEPDGRCQPLQHGDVHLWKFGLDVPVEILTGLHSLLSPVEQQTYARLIDTEKGNRRVSSRGRLRQILEMYTGIPAGKIPLRVLPGGKPMIASDYNPLHLDFNLSHCEGFAVVVICRGRLCGIDLEKLVPYESIVHIQAALSEAGEPVVESGKLLSAWTQREALLKAIGTGWRGANQPMDSSAWTVTCVEPFEGFIASLAVEVNLSPENISSYIY